MAKSICPHCLHVTLSLRYESRVKCFQCERIFEVSDREGDSADISTSEEEE